MSEQQIEQEQQPRRKLKINRNRPSADDQLLKAEYLRGRSEGYAEGHDNGYSKGNKEARRQISAEQYREQQSRQTARQVQTSVRPENMHDVVPTVTMPGGAFFTYRLSLHVERDVRYMATIFALRINKGMQHNQIERDFCVEFPDHMQDRGTFEMINAAAERLMDEALPTCEGLVLAAGIASLISPNQRDCEEVLHNLLRRHGLEDEYAALGQTSELRADAFRNPSPASVHLAGSPFRG